MVPVGSGSMVYTIDQKVITLDQFGEDRFLTLLDDLKSLDHISNSRNSDWFDYIPQQYKDSKYLEWFFLMDGDEFVSFSTIQEFKPMIYRCMTRTYVDIKYRSLFSVRDPKAITVTGHFLPAQLEFLGGWGTAFLTRQDPKRRRSFERTRGRAEYWTKKPWVYYPKLVKTFDDPHDPDAWQNVIYNGDEPDLHSMTLERYYEVFPNKR